MGAVDPWWECSARGIVKEAVMFTTENNDTGSLKVGTTAGDHVWEVGQSFQIEEKVYKVSYIMGKEAKMHLCCKGCGPLPVGAVEYQLVK